MIGPSSRVSEFLKDIGAWEGIILKNQLKHLLNFRDYFQTESTAPIDFSGRLPPNLQHDLFYLNSYIHDATFLIKQVELRKKKLCIPMERTRWELYDSLGTVDPPTISSVLTLEHVKKITWELKKWRELKKWKKPSKTFIVSHTFLGELFWENFGGEGNLEIILTGADRSKLRIQVGEKWGTYGSFRLVDVAADKRLH